VSKVKCWLCGTETRDKIPMCRQCAVEIVPEREPVEIKHIKIKKPSKLFRRRIA